MLILQLQKRGIISGKRIISDARLVEADAAMDSLVEREDSDPEARQLKAYECRYHDFKEGKRERKISNQTHVSKTDPDSTLVSKGSTYKKLSYKTHYWIAADSSMIVDCYATTDSRYEYYSSRRIVSNKKLTTDNCCLKSYLTHLL